MPRPLIGPSVTVRMPAGTRQALEWAWRVFWDERGGTTKPYSLANALRLAVNYYISRYPESRRIDRDPLSGPAVPVRRYGNDLTETITVRLRSEQAGCLFEAWNVQHSRGHYTECWSLSAAVRDATAKFLRDFCREARLDT